MKVSDNRCCFICGPGNPIGLKVKPSRDETTGRAWMTVVIPREYQGWEGIAHGGIVAALLDEVSAYATMSVSKQVVTGELTIRYLKPVPIGQEITVAAHVCEQVRRTVKVESIMTWQGETLARAEARMVVLRSSSINSVKPDK